MDKSSDYIYKSKKQNFRNSYQIITVLSLIAVILIGDVDVGKTCLLSRYLKN